MRIITGHDYYDTALAFGPDDHVVFVREKDRHVKADDLPGFELEYPRISFVDKKTGDKDGNSFGPFKGTSLRHNGYSYLIQLVYVVVCGKWYAGFRLERSSQSWRIEKSWRLENEHTDVVWTQDALIEWFDQYGIDVLAEKPRNYVDQECSLEHYFARRELSKPEMDWILENGVTIMLRNCELYGPNTETWSINCDGLKDIKFYRVFDAFAMFQEVEMWVGGVLANAGRPTVEIIDDKMKIAKHGFDDLSFRKPKQSK